MDKKLKTKWLKALRGGRYRQGDCKLYSEVRKTYCCLGVLGRVMGKSAKTLAGDASSSTPKSWDVIPVVQVDRLITMNDSEHKTFHEIADHIEANL